MNAAKVSFLVLVAWVVAISSVYAATFSVATEPVVNRIEVQEFAYYNVSITNLGIETDDFRVYTPDFPTWDVRTEPLINPITLSLEPQETGTVTLVVDPLKIRDIGTYGVNVNVRSSKTDGLITTPVKVSVISTDSLIQGYVPTVITSLDVPEIVDPREPIPIRFIFSNQNIIDYPELIVQVQSDLIQDEFAVKLGPKEEKTVEKTYAIDPLTKEQSDNLVVALLFGDRSIINPLRRSFSVQNYHTEDLVQEEKGFLQRSQTYEIISNDAAYSEPLRVETSLLRSIFSRTSPHANTVVVDGQRYFEWDVSLSNSSFTAEVKENYMPLFIIIIVIIVVIILYFMLRSPLVIRKETSNVRKREGGVGEMTIVLHVKNRGQYKITNLMVSEPVPRIAHISKESAIGSMQPTKVLHHQHKGAVVQWKIDSLDVQEERVLSYKISSKLSILGGFTLPPTNATFTYRHKHATGTSNRLTVNE